MQINKQLVINGILAGFEEMYLTAIEKGEIFHHEERDWWFLPDELKTFIESGKCIYVFDGWSLRSAMEMVEAINEKIFKLHLKREDVVRWGIENNKRIEYIEGEPLIIDDDVKLI